MNYQTTFGQNFRVFLHVSHYVLLLVIFPMTLLCLPGSDDASTWAETGRWIIGIIITSFVGLMGAYIWMRSKMTAWPDRPMTVVSSVFSFAGVSILASIVTLSLYGLCEAQVLAWLGASFAVVALGFQVVAALTVVWAWQVQREGEQG